MKHFDSMYSKNNKKVLSVAIDFNYMLDNLWCTYSEHKGERRWRDICKNIPSEFQRAISIEISHVLLGHGREQALMATKSEMEKYLNYLLEEK